MKLFCFLLSFLMLSGCFAKREAYLSEPESTVSHEENAISQSSIPFSSESVLPEEWQQEDVVDGIHPFVKSRLQEIASMLLTPDMSEYARAKAAFDYVLDNMTREEAVGQELWRIHGGGDTPIPYLEQRALSPLHFGIGMCEDYAAALTLLLRELGLEAEYVPGLLYTVEGTLADHAWTVVQIDGTWYHLDSHLEDYISRGRTVRYRYFLHGDQTFAVTHVWGQRLINMRLLSQEQNEEIAARYIPPACPQDYPNPPQARTMQEAPMPDLDGLKEQINAEINAYQQQNGLLPEMELNRIPPVFGLEGYPLENEQEE